MPGIAIHFTYNLEFTPAEFRILGLALAGKLREGDDIHAAIALNNKLQQQRLKFIESLQATFASAAQIAAEDAADPPRVIERLGHQDERWKTTLGTEKL